MINKRGLGALIWVLIIVILIIIGIIIYFVVSGDSGGALVSDVGGSIPQPPALPE